MPNATASAVTFTTIVSLAAANFDAIVARGVTSNDAISRVAAAIPHLFPEVSTLDGVALDAVECERLAVTAAARGATARRVAETAVSA